MVSAQYILAMMLFMPLGSIHPPKVMPVF